MLLAPIGTADPPRRLAVLPEVARVRFAQHTESLMRPPAPPSAAAARDRYPPPCARA